MAKKIKISATIEELSIIAKQYEEQAAKRVIKDIENMPKNIFGDLTRFGFENEEEFKKSMIKTLKNKITK